MPSASDKTDRIRSFIEKYKYTVESCEICPHRCGVDRRVKLGRCKEPYLPRVASMNLHHGEEPPLSGTRGSGTIFFSGCNMNCVYCQNFPISQMHQANTQMTIAELGDAMLDLQKRRAHNINFVTPSHYIYQAVSALLPAVEKGLDIPVVLNTSGYDRPDVIRDLEGIVDIFLPDMKYIDAETSRRYSNVNDYFEMDSACLKEIYRQTGGGLELDENGIATGGMIIRHLVLPSNVDNSIGVLRWIKENLSADVHLSIMAQYFPAHRVSGGEFPEIDRKLSREEYDTILDEAENLGFSNAFIQEYELKGD
jgi:putative pyruvate formate lyase activating enzyme